LYTKEHLRASEHCDNKHSTVNKTQRLARNMNHANGASGEDEDEAFVAEVEDAIKSSFFRKDSIQLGYSLTLVEPIWNDQIAASFK
jgi:hypothetical protein